MGRPGKPDFSIPRTLDELLAPQDAATFLEKTWGSCFARIHGSSGRFAELMPWSVVNSMLEEHDLAASRLRLYKDGSELSQSRFLAHGDIKVVELQRELATGATMIIGAVEQFYRPLRVLIASLEQVFRLPVQANLYAGFRKNSGFKLHWDEQDTLIVQIGGRKRWRICLPDHPYPLNSLNPQDGPGPVSAASVIWDGILNDGDLLHIPRGHWHVASPLDEPSLHLTITIRPRTGLDLMRWLAEEAITDPIVRKNVPWFSGKADQAKWIKAIRNTLPDACSDDVIERYFAAMDADALPRPTLQLPRLPSLRETKIDLDTPIRLAAPRRLHFTRAGKGAVNFKCCGQLWTASETVVPVLKVLMDGRPHTLRELLQGRSTSAAAAARLLIQAMALRQTIVRTD